MWCEVRSPGCAVRYGVWDELKVLSPPGINAQKASKLSNLCSTDFLNHLFVGGRPRRGGGKSESGADTLFEVAAHNWLVISVYHLAINTGRQWDQRMWHQQKVFTGAISPRWRAKVTGENASDSCAAFICGVTGALILSNVKICGEMNGGIGMD